MDLVIIGDHKDTLNLTDLELETIDLVLVESVRLLEIVGLNDTVNLVNILNLGDTV